MHNLAFRGLRLPRLGAMRGGGAVAPLIAPLARYISNTGTTGTPVSAWSDTRGNWPDLVQSTAAARPALTSGALVFDGVGNSNGSKMATSGLAFNVGVQGVKRALPSATRSGGVAFGITGLCQTSTGFAAINYGEERLTDTGFRTPTIVKLNSSWANVGEIALTSPNSDDNALYAFDFESSPAVQGIASDTTGSRFWVNTSGSGVVAVNFDGTVGPSFSASGGGIAYDSVNNQLLISNGTTVTRYSVAGVSTGTTYTLPESADMLVLDPSDNNILWYTQDANTVHAYDLTTASDVTLPMAGVDSIEGIVVTSTRLYVANDGYLHSATSNENFVIEFPFSTATLLRELNSGLTQAFGFHVFLVMDNNWSSLTKMAFSFGNGVNAAGYAAGPKSSTNGAGSSFVPGDIGRAEDLVDAGGLPTEYAIWEYGYNSIRRGWFLRINGAQVAAGQNASILAADTTDYEFYIGGNAQDSRQLPMTLKEIVLYDNSPSAAERTELLGNLAETYGITLE